MKQLQAHILAILLAYIPSTAFAHAEHTVQEEVMLYLGNNPLALLGLAFVAGITVGGTVFVFRHDKKKAFSSGLVLSVLSAFLLLASFGVPEGRSVALAPSEQMLAGATATVYKSASCGCCGGYIEELKRQGANVDVRVVGDAELAKVKMEHGVASALQSCHTSIIDGYVVEGHVPIEAVAKLRSEKPDISGIALPGMPSGTPGMPGPKFAPYDVRMLDGQPYLEI